ncbi:MAG: hypothetical protein COW55_11875, partial [Rhodobacteraceae bacterium CG17_big_fil_post_rev_8_21_14_2_50_65_11]
CEVGLSLLRNRHIGGEEAKVSGGGHGISGSLGSRPVFTRNGRKLNPGFGRDGGEVSDSGRC